MTTEEAWDVLVVGAGPAGSRAAEAAARRDARVLMVDRRKEVGRPVQCAEFLHRRVAMDLGLPSDAISQEIGGMVTFVSGEEATSQRNPGYILNREVLDQVLAGRAVEAGAELRTGTSAVGPLVTDGNGARMRLEDRGKGQGAGRVSARVIVGADGPLSTVGALLGHRNQDLVVAHQRTVVLNEPSMVTEVHLDPGFKGGYAWLFPKGDLANVGVGLSKETPGRVKGALDGFIDGLGDRVGEVVRATGGRIPVGGPLRTVHGSVVLVGDAAGHTHPITGGGIHQAIECGRLAGEAAAMRLEGQEGALETYDDAWRSLFGPVLERARRRRDEMERGWNAAAQDPSTFEELMRRSWIAFRGYHRQER